MILDLIEKDLKITQRSIGEAIDAAVSMVNKYLNIYEAKGYLFRNHITAKTVEYLITKKGIERRKVLNIRYLNSSQQLYNSAKVNILYME